MLSRTALRTLGPATTRPSIRLSPVRCISQTSRLAARKDAQDKDALKPESNEYSKSASDEEAARIEETAFSRDKTKPEEQLHSAEQERGTGNPLDVSPANHDISRPRAPTEGGAESSSSQSGKGPSDRKETSGGSGTGSSYKKGDGKRYE